MHSGDAVHVTGLGDPDLDPEVLDPEVPEDEFPGPPGDPDLVLRLAQESPRWPAVESSISARIAER